MFLLKILRNRCPYCHKGSVFANSNLLSLAPGKMHNDCPRCQARFAREPGFFWGAMYVSYALATAEAFITYFVCRLLGTGMYDLSNLAAIVAVILVLSPLNFRLARLVWLYIFSGIDE